MNLVAVQTSYFNDLQTEIPETGYCLSHKTWGVKDEDKEGGVFQVPQTVELEREREGTKRERENPFDSLPLNDITH